MRVRIQYGVELEEVPETVSNLIEEEAGLLSWCSHTIDEVCSALVQEEPNIKFALNKMDKVRQKLGSLDARLVDMEALLQGYDAASNPTEPQQSPIIEPSVTEAATPAAPMPTSNKVDPETGVYNYERPYSVPEEAE
jgi:hypothetical protein